MRHPRLFVFGPLVLASVLVLASGSGGCGDDAAPSGGANSTTPDPGLLLLGDCEPGATSCNNDGATCAATGLESLGVCPLLPTYYDEPGCGPTGDFGREGQINPTCCTDADCTEAAAGHCIYTEQQTGCCGPQGTTSCVYDGCQSDADCGAAEICLPVGTHGLAANTCAPAPCLQDADCTDAAGGECRLLGRDISTALVCTYPDFPCQEDTDCPEGECGPGWCSPRWTSNDQGRVLDTGVRCMDAGDDCQLP